MAKPERLGENWIETTEELPSDFDYALALDASNPDTIAVNRGMIVGFLP